MAQNIYLQNYLVVELAVDRLPILVHHLECVRSVAIHVAIAIRDATVTEQDGHLQRETERGRERVGEREKGGGREEGREN